MLRLFHYPPADLLAREGSDLILQCDEILSGRAWLAATVAGETINVRVEIVEEFQPGAEPFPAPWMDELRAGLQLAPKKHLYRARVRRPVDFLPYLEVLLEPTPRSTEQRATPRMTHHIRVMGPQLPDFRGTVRDLSEAGIGLDLVGPLPLGTRLSLTLEPDGGKDTPFEVEAQVCWCRANVAGRRAPDETGRAHAYEVGACFLPLTPNAKQLLSAFLDKVGKLEV